MVHNMSASSISKLHAIGVKTIPVDPLPAPWYLEDKRESLGKRDSILWSKLRAWQLEEYEKVFKTSQFFEY